jgi:hypothetical protein
VKILRAWILVSAIILIVSFAAHLSTFFPIDPMESIPGIMFIHVAIFPPFIAAILSANKATREQGYDHKRILQLAPAWMRTMFYAFFAYALLNFVLFFILSGGNAPTRLDGKYFLTQHGRVVREISEAEYHRQKAYVVRGFSGHWMMFSVAAMAMLTGVAQCRKNVASS